MVFFPYIKTSSGFLACLKKPVRKLVVPVFFLVSTTTAEAVTISAISNDPASYSGFTITYTDVNGNGLLNWFEVDSFSGLTATFPGLVETYSFLTWIPEIAGLSEQGWFNDPFEPLHPHMWHFSNSEFGTIPQVSCLTICWSYEVDGVPLEAVPLPAGIWLFLSAMASAVGMFGARGTRSQQARGQTLKV